MDKDRDKAIRLLDGLARYMGARTHHEESIQGNYPRRDPAWRLGIMNTVATAMGKQLGLDADMEQAFADLHTGYHTAAQNGLPVLPEPYEQRDTIQRLRRLANWAETHAEEAGPILFAIHDCLEDVLVFLPWDVERSGVFTARDYVEAMCCRYVALQPITFTRVLVGGDYGPSDSDFEPGHINSPELVAQTGLFDQMCENNPEIRTWPICCTIYHGHYGDMDAREPNPDELRFMRQMGDRFLRMEGVHPLTGSLYFDIPAPSENTIGQSMDM